MRHSLLKSALFSLLPLAILTTAGCQSTPDPVTLDVVGQKQCLADLSAEMAGIQDSLGGDFQKQVEVVVMGKKSSRDFDHRWTLEQFELVLKKIKPRSEHIAGTASLLASKGAPEVRKDAASVADKAVGFNSAVTTMLDTVTALQSAKADPAPAPKSKE
jgi:hypothetical protein